MKKVILYISVYIVSFTALSQVRDIGGPVSFHLNLKKSISPIRMPSIDIEKIKAEDEINDMDRSKPFRFGYEYKVDLGMNTTGTWYDLDNGDRLWLINIVSTGAKTMNFVFDKYYIPEGASLYLYNNSRTDVLGAYTNVMNREDLMLGTWLVEGDSIWIEYFEPASKKGKGILNLHKVIHGYRSITDQEAVDRSFVKSGNCNHDVNCTVGNDFDPLKERLKHSVAHVIMSGFVCSGGLINNTNNDGAPYFLTARHCDAGAESGWAFRFNWINEDPICGGPNNSATGPRTQTTSGATALAINSITDVKLLRLDGGLDADWDLEWAGWDRSDDIPEFTVGIHHPRGDIMKTSRDNDPPGKTITGFNGNSAARFWVIDDENNLGGWEIGVTEGGSSGSPLFDANGRIIGQLAAGSAECTQGGSGTDDNGGFDIYGRFGISWDFGNNTSNRLKEWLDPNNTNQITLDMLSQETGTLGITETNLNSEIIVYPIPAQSEISIRNTSGQTLKYAVFTLSGEKMASGEITFHKNKIDLQNFTSGVYFLSLQNSGNGTEFTQKIVVKK